MSCVLRLAKYAMGFQSEKDQGDEQEQSDEGHKILLESFKKFMQPLNPKRFDEDTHKIPASLFNRSTSIGPQNWIHEFESMGLPSFSEQYMQLVHVPLDVMHECLRLQAELGKELLEPSPHSVRQVSPSQALVAYHEHLP